MTFVVGTAGHVDHGKSSLVRALTGIEPDRWEEEQRRQLTIDLGFAWLTLPDGRDIGIVDVPGHEDFIENMLAGVGGIDVALLVVAADEGIMPQTREHLSILTLLKVPRLVVVLTKIDLVDDDELLELVRLEIDDMLAETHFTDVPVLAVSAHTGEGLEPLLAALANTLDQLRESPAQDAPRLPIDRVFTLSGFGTIVTGTLLGGALRIDDMVELQPAGLSGRIRGLQSHEQAIQVAEPGNRVAVNLAGINHNEVARGEVLAPPGLITPTQLVDVMLDYLPDAPQTLKHNAEVKVFAGTSETMARVRLLLHEKLDPGMQSPAQLVLHSPMPLLRQQRFIVRRPSPAITIGGGVVLDIAPRQKWKRNRADIAERFTRLAQSTPQALLEELLLEQQSSIHIHKDLPALLSKKGMVFVQAELPTSADAVEEIVSVGDYLIHIDVLQKQQQQVLKRLQRFHKAHPAAPGMPISQLRNQLRLPNVVLWHLLEVLEHELAEAVIVPPVIRLQDFAPSYTRQQQALLQQLQDALEQQPYTPPSYKDVMNLVGAELLEALVLGVDVVRINQDVLLAWAVYEEWVLYAQNQLAAGTPLTVSTFRDAFSTSRKYALAFLEFLDSRQVTRRVNDEHFIGQGDWETLFSPYTFV